MTEQEWLTRYKQRLIDQSHIDEAFAEDCAHAEPFAVLSDMFEDDPEGAADEELSCWEH